MSNYFILYSAEGPEITGPTAETLAEWVRSL